MRISPWRSAKCSGTSFQPSWPWNSGPLMSIASASAQTAPCGMPSRNDAAMSSPMATAVLTDRPVVTARRSTSSSRHAR